MELTERQQAYCDAVEANLKGCEAVSSGTCPTCPECMERDGFEDEEAHEDAWSSGDLTDEPSFSWSSCGICGCNLGGDRHTWHFVIPKDGSCKGRPIYHETDACTDCVMYLANGEVPDDAYLDWID